MPYNLSKRWGVKSFVHYDIVNMRDGTYCLDNIVLKMKIEKHRLVKNYVFDENIKNKYQLPSALHV